MPKLVVDDILDKIEQLPEPPQITMRVRQMLEDETTTAEQLADVIKLDAWFTGQILKLSNSAAYGLKNRIASVKEAVAIVGFRVLKSMVYTILASSTLSESAQGYSLEKGDLWHNGLTCALYAKHIASKQADVDNELAYTAGLLHGIGKVVLSDAVGVNYADIESLAYKKRIDFLSAEEEVVGINHCQAGARIAKNWGLPAVLINSIAYYNKPSSAPDDIDLNAFKVMTCVHLANLLTHMIGKSNGADGLMYALDNEALSRSSLTTGKGYFDKLVSELVDLNPVIQSTIESMRASKQL
ncbi:MAG: HDOD domain-containing protein [Cyanobacteria bacterium P01_H01_bin.74]